MDSLRAGGFLGRVDLRLDLRLDLFLNLASRLRFKERHGQEIQLMAVLNPRCRARSGPAQQLSIEGEGEGH